MKQADHLRVNYTNLQITASTADDPNPAEIPALCSS